MFKALSKTFINLGKKAIGYIRGLNGDKLAALASSLVSARYPSVGPIVAPALSYAGNKLNSLMDYLATEAPLGNGVHKPGEFNKNHKLAMLAKAALMRDKRARFAE